MKTTPENQTADGSPSGAASCSPSSETPETEAHPSRWQQGASAEFIHADFARKLERERNSARAEAERWKKDIIPFLALHASAYGRDHYGEGCMHFTHYDTLLEAGARMDDFKRCGNPSPENKLLSDS